MKAIEVLPIVGGICDVTEDLDSSRFLAVIAVVIDHWADHHKLSNDEKQMLLKTLIKMQTEKEPKGEGATIPDGHK